MKKMSNVSFYASWNFILGKMHFESCDHSGCVEIKHLDEKNYFVFPLHTKANYLLSKIQGFHLSNANRCSAHLVRAILTSHPGPVRWLPSKPQCWNAFPPSFPAKFPCSRPSSPLPSDTPPLCSLSSPFQFPVVLLGDWSPPGDQSYTDSFKFQALLKHFDNRKASMCGLFYTQEKCMGRYGQSTPSITRL